MRVCLAHILTSCWAQNRLGRGDEAGHGLHGAFEDLAGVLIGALEEAMTMKMWKTGRR